MLYTKYFHIFKNYFYLLVLFEQLKLLVVFTLLVEILSLSNVYFVLTLRQNYCL